MTISILGSYELPLTDEERETIFKEVRGYIVKDATSLVRQRALSVQSSPEILPRLGFTIQEPELMIKELKHRFSLISILMERDHPEFAELRDIEKFSATYKFNDDGVPSVVLSDWLQAIVDEKTTVSIDPTLVPDTVLVGKHNQLQKRGILKYIVKKENELIIKFNDDLNELADGYPYDFTDVIKEIVKATKEGKFDE